MNRGCICAVAVAVGCLSLPFPGIQILEFRVIGFVLAAALCLKQWWLTHGGSDGGLADQGKYRPRPTGLFCRVCLQSKRKINDKNLLQIRGRISKDGKGPGCNRVEAVHGGDDLQAHVKNTADVSHTRRIAGITGVVGAGADSQVT